MRRNQVSTSILFLNPISPTFHLFVYLLSLKLSHGFFLSLRTYTNKIDEQACEIITYVIYQRVLKKIKVKLVISYIPDSGIFVQMHDTDVSL